MILAFDSYYYENKAKTVCLAFENFEDKKPLKIIEDYQENVTEYEPGNFYKRELPCILSLLEKHHFENIETIIIDGFVFLDDNQKLGLGGHLYKSLDEKIPIIGVAKTNFSGINLMKKEIYRGESNNPLFITAIGIDLNTASENILKMHGNFRFPTLLKQLDSLTKQ